MAHKSWEITDEFWSKVEPLIPKPKRDPNKSYQRKRGAGRKPMETRKAFEAIVFVLRTGIQWKALPKEYGSSSSVHRYFQKWAKAGLFELPNSKNRVFAPEPSSNPALNQSKAQVTGFWQNRLQQRFSDRVSLQFILRFELRCLRRVRTESVFASRSPMCVYGWA